MNTVNWMVTSICWGRLIALTWPLWSCCIRASKRISRWGWTFSKHPILWTVDELYLCNFKFVFNIPTLRINMLTLGIQQTTLFLPLLLCFLMNVKHGKWFPKSNKFITLLTQIIVRLIWTFCKPLFIFLKSLSLDQILLPYRLQTHHIHMAGCTFPPYNSICTWSPPWTKSELDNLCFQSPA